MTRSQLIKADVLTGLWKRFVDVQLKNEVLGPGGSVNSFNGRHYDADNRDLTGAFKCPVRVTCPI
jgi:hypothetical protein